MMKLQTRAVTLVILLLLVWGWLSISPAMANEVTVDNITENAYFQIQGQWNYTIVHKVVVTNNGSSTAKNIKLDVPLMDDQCPAYMDLIGEQFDPYPQSINSSVNGVRSATYSISSLAPNQSKVLYQRYAVTTSSLIYDINAAAVSYDYDQIDNLSIEGRQKLVKFKPATMGQASRISGVNSADLAVLAMSMKQGKGKKKA